jgi:hypothetical protein
MNTRTTQLSLKYGACSMSLEPEQAAFSIAEASAWGLQLTAMIAQTS